MPQIIEPEQVEQEGNLQTPSTSIEEAKRIAELSSLTYRQMRSYYLAGSNVSSTFEKPSDFEDELPKKGRWKSIGASRVLADEAIRKELEQFYFLKNPAEVVRFVSGSTSLLSWLPPTYYMIRVYFPHSEVHLEVMTDPEVEEDTKLVAFIIADLDPNEVIERLGQFDERWMSNLPRYIEAEFVVTVEF